MRLSEEQRHALVEAVVHLVNRDFAQLARLYSTFGFAPAGQTADVAALAAALHAALPDVLEAPVGEFNLRSVRRRRPTCDGRAARLSLWQPARAAPPRDLTRRSRATALPRGPLPDRSRCRSRC